MPNQSNQSSQSAARGRGSNARSENTMPQAGQGQRATGQQAAEDHLYGVVSVLYHALQGEQAYQQYASDARKAGDAELEQFFDECRTEEHSRAQQAKSLLADRLEEEEEDDDASDDEDDDDEDDDEAGEEP